MVIEQAFGEALPPNKLERLGRYEVHLDRKAQRLASDRQCDEHLAMQRLSGELRPTIGNQSIFSSEGVNLTASVTVALEMAV